jgi:hypothetical protein
MAWAWGGCSWFVLVRLGVGGECQIWMKTALGAFACSGSGSFRLPAEGFRCPSYGLFVVRGVGLVLHCYPRYSTCVLQGAIGRSHNPQPLNGVLVESQQLSHASVDLKILRCGF